MSWYVLRLGEPESADRYYNRKSGLELHCLHSNANFQGWADYSSSRGARLSCACCIRATRFQQGEMASAAAPQRLKAEITSQRSRYA